MKRYNYKTIFSSITALTWCLLSHPLTLGAQTPYLRYETVTGAKVLGHDTTSSGQTYNQKSVLGNLAVPLVRNDDFMVGPGVTFAQTEMSWASNYIADRADQKRGFTALSLFAVQTNEQRAVQGFLVYAQRRDLSFAFPHPLHEITLGGGVKHTFWGLLPSSVTLGRLTLGVILRRFPGTDRILPYFSQALTSGDKEILIEFPGTISYAVKRSEGKEKYRVAMIIDDVPLTPRTTEDNIQVWGVDSYRVALVGSFERQIIAPVVMQASGGGIMEKIEDLDSKGQRWQAYTTTIAPYFQIGLTAWL